MSDPKVTPSQLRRSAVVYVRQSTLAQVDRNRESTARQYDLVARAERLGWPRSAVRIIDDDLGLSGASTTGAFGRKRIPAGRKFCSVTASFAPSPSPSRSS